MKYLQSQPFSVRPGENENYRNNWDAVFGKKKTKKAAPKKAGKTKRSK